MKGMNMIIGKRQIILASLVLGLGIAVYLNWQYSNTGLELASTSILDKDVVTNYGEARFVEGNVENDEESILVATAEDDDEIFFVEAKMSRQKARDEAVETLAGILQDANLDATQKADLAIRAANLANSIEVEGKIENLIKSKGLSDVMVYYDTVRADVIVRTDGLEAAQVAQIKDIILSETVIVPENIKIVEIN